MKSDHCAAGGNGALLGGGGSGAPCGIIGGRAAAVLAPAAAALWSCGGRCCHGLEGILICLSRIACTTDRAGGGVGWRLGGIITKQGEGWRSGEAKRRDEGGGVLSPARGAAGPACAPRSASTRPC